MGGMMRKVALYILAVALLAPMNRTAVADDLSEGLQALGAANANGFVSFGSAGEVDADLNSETDTLERGVRTYVPSEDEEGFPLHRDLSVPTDGSTH